jgi:phytoene dehydrogenase-like protein
LDDSLVDGAGHTVYLACPAAPFVVDGGWEAAGERLAEDVLSQVERLAPGFRAGVRGVHVRTPERMASELRWPGAHPMHLDMTPDQLGPLRPTAALAGHRTPVEGLFVSGAGTAPAGGVSGLPGRGAARAVLCANRGRTGLTRYRLQP